MLATERDLNDTEIFIKVVEQGSFTAAGRVLHQPKSSISRKVSRLEQRLGVRLLHRTTRSLTLTPAGETYFEKASRVLQELDSVEAVVAGLGETPRGTLRVTIPVSFQALAHRLFIEFLDLYPEVRLELAVTDRYVDLVAEGYDVAVRGGCPPDPSLSGQKILNSAIKLVASQEYLESRGRPKSPTDLKEHHCILHSLQSTATWRFETPRGNVDVTVSGRFSSNNLQAVLEATRAGYGIARIPTESGLSPGGLEEVLPGLCPTGGGLWLIYPSARQLAPSVKAFVEFVKEKLHGQLAP